MIIRRYIFFIGILVGVSSCYREVIDVETDKEVFVLAVSPEVQDFIYAPAFYFRPREEYESRFNEIYTNLPLYHGMELYEVTAQRIYLEHYFRKMGIDCLLQNGDYTDEIYLYAMIHKGNIRYNLIPWDYDDLFKEIPHEVGVSWGTGTIFGNRSYTSTQDITEEIGEKLIFSIEDDLDYAIAKDSFMNVCYENTLREMTDDLDEQFLEERLNAMKNHLKPGQQ